MIGLISFRKTGGRGKIYLGKITHRKAVTELLENLIDGFELKPRDVNTLIFCSTLKCYMVVYTRNG